jgi:hypothetical protein
MLKINELEKLIKIYIYSKLHRHNIYIKNVK